MKYPPKRLMLCSGAIVLIITSLGLAFAYPKMKSRRSVQSPAQVQEPQSETIAKSSQSEPKSLSPYGIKWFIEENRFASLKSVWQRLGIPNHPSDPFFDEALGDCGKCDAEVYLYDLDGEPGKEYLLRVAAPTAGCCRYLVFKEVEGQSDKLLGYIDHDFAQYRMPQHSFLVCGGQTYLLIEVQVGSGSGVATYRNRLFKVRPDGVTEMLNFAAEGHREGCCAMPRQEFSSRVMNCEVKDGRATVEIEYSVSYIYSTLWEKKQRAVYRSDVTGRLVLDPTHSDLSEEEIRDVYDNESFGYEDLVKYNAEELKRIARGHDKEQKEWLRQFLHECPCPESAEARTLERLLDH